MTSGAEPTGTIDAALKRESTDVLMQRFDFWAPAQQLVLPH
jgi:hypothetical protein